MNLIWMGEFRDEGEAREKTVLLRQGMLLKKIKGKVECGHRPPTPAERRAGKFGGKWMVTQFLKEAA